MTTVHHLNCGNITSPSGGRAICHCLLLEDATGLALVDAGLGLSDVFEPSRRLGQSLVDSVGFRLKETDTALRQLERRGFSEKDVRHIILTHADPDHAGGVSDFPNAIVHLAGEEYEALVAGDPRYRLAQFEHRPTWKLHAAAEQRWFGLEARALDLGWASEVLLIPLFGHTRGHSGVAIQQGNRWILHAGDTYYLRSEIYTEDHPISALSTKNAVDDLMRRRSLEQIRRIAQDQHKDVEFFGYHDPDELPSS